MNVLNKTLINAISGNLSIFLSKINNIIPLYNDFSNIYSKYKDIKNDLVNFKNKFQNSNSIIKKEEIKKEVETTSSPQFFL